MAGGHYPCCCVPRDTISGRGSSPPVGSIAGPPGSGGSLTVPCPCCVGGIAPPQIRVVVPNLVPYYPLGHPLHCLDCEELEGTYYLDWVAPEDTATYREFCARGSCLWALQFAEVCGYSRASFWLECSPGGSVWQSFQITKDVCFSGDKWHRWFYSLGPTSPANFGGRMDCNAYSFNLFQANVDQPCVGELSPTVTVHFPEA